MKRITLYALGACAVACGVLCASGKSTKADISRNMAIFGDIYKELQTNYVDTLDARKTMRTAIDALLGSIDPYTEYFSEEEQDKITSVSSGEYDGIGSTIMKRDTTIVLSAPGWDSPARRAGVHHGDVLLAIDGTPVDAAFTIDRASSMLKGQPGTEVKVKVRRPYLPAGQDSIFEFDIVRGSIKINPIPYYGIIDDAQGTGYIAITTFNENTAGDFRKALESLRATGKLKNLIVDLRDNGGGLLESAVRVASNFVPRGTEIVSVKGRNPRDVRTHKTTSSPIEPKMPVVVLINGQTASAAEILAGSLQDLDRAVVVGKRSYGKGLVQNVRPVPYNGLMKVTTGRYYIPSGRLIQAIDYSHRDANGNVTRIPDSLTNVFHTVAGREVRDGGGITPDITVKLPDGNRLLYNIVADLWVEDFANRVANNTATAPDPAQWEVTDSLFAQFKATIDPGRFKYDRATDEGIKYLREAARVEGYTSPAVTATIDSLEKLMRHDLYRDLDFNSKEIKSYLDGELSTRWYDEAEVVRRGLHDDLFVKEALLILVDPRQYGVLLAAPSKEKKK